MQRLDNRLRIALDVRPRQQTDDMSLGLNRVGTLSKILLKEVPGMLSAACA